MKYPNNWLITNLEVILERITNGSSLKQIEEKAAGYYPISRIETIANEKIDFNRVKYVLPSEDDIEKYGLKYGDILFSHINSDKHLGKTAIFTSEETLIHGINLLLIRSNKNYNSFFLNYLFKYFRQSGIFIGLAQRAVNQSSINQKKLKAIQIPLPPLPEQQRIVAKLDTLFASLESTKSRLDKIPQLLKYFRQAVLTQAVTGKLTEEWREGKELEEWKKTKLSQLIKEKPRNGFSPKGVDYETNVKSLTLSATTTGKFDPTKVKYLDIDAPDKESHLWLKKGDILIQRSNSLDYVGTSAIYDCEDYEFIYPDIMMKIQVNEGVSNIFISYVLSSTETKTYFKDNASGTAGNMPKINQGVVMNTPVTYPDILEQQEIVRRVESLFAKADAIEKRYKALKQKIDTLPQALLGKAFKGELVEQLPTDGDAKDLLAEIQKAKESLKTKPKGRKKMIKEEVGMVAEPEVEYKTKK